MKSNAAWGTGPKGKATKLHSQLVRSRGACEHCGSTLNLQCAHIIPRRFSATRTDETNAFCLCAKCHFRFGEHVDEWIHFIGRTIGMDEMMRLKHKALANKRSWKATDWQAECDRLKALLGAAA